MKKSETLTPCRFDDKDVLLPEFWELLNNYYENVPFCTGKNDTEALFYIHTDMGDRPLKARILHTRWNRVEVTALQDNGTIWLEEVKILKEIFMLDNTIEDTDIFVECEIKECNGGRIIAVTFSYFHSEE